MPRNHNDYLPSLLMEAWERSDGFCECCDRPLNFEDKGREKGDFGWEPHWVEGMDTPLILCTGWPQHCHLNCGHNGDWRNKPVIPLQHNARIRTRIRKSKRKA